MDQMDLLHQFLPPAIQPLQDDMVVVGRAMPVLVEDIHEGNKHLVKEKPFGLLLEAIDSLQPREVYVASGGAPTYALWGELVSTRAIKLGASGAVLNGYVRDTIGILDLGFPTFSFGRYAQDQAPRGTVVDFRLPIQIEKVKINPGDIVFGDIDGVCVIPKAQEENIIQKSLEKALGEKEVRIALENGMSTVEAFKVYGIM